MALPAILAIKQNHEDDIEGSVMYAFTCNPKAQFYEHVDGVDKYDPCYQHNWKKMISVLKHLNRCCSKYLIIPETSETGKLHCHGWFVMKDSIKWKKSVKGILEKQLGFIKINKVTDNNAFLKKSYYSKDLEETLTLIGDHKLMLLGHLTCKNVLEYISKQKIVLEDMEVPKYDIEKFFLVE